MSENVIKDTASDGLLPAMDANMAAFWSAYGRAKGSTLHAAGNVIWFYTGLPVPLFNGVVLARLAQNEVKAVVDALQAKLDEHGAPAVWWVGQQSTPADLGSRLEQYGLALDGEAPGMAIDLEAVEDAALTIPNFTIQKVNTPEMRAIWARTVAVGMGIPEGVADGLVRLESNLSDALDQAQPRYLGYLNGVPVATSALVLAAGVAGIYAVATIPEARHKGIGRGMTAAPLIEARRMGYRVGILQASAEGYPLYQRMGFKDVGRYRIYLQEGKEGE